MKDISAAVEKYRKLILDTERYIWQHPETGYREFKTSEYMEKAFENLGYTLNKAGNIPGFYTIFDTGRKGPEVLILGELDSLICPNHKEADKETGYVHACGHNAQCAALIGIAAALKEESVSGRLCGRVRLCAVPAEELIEVGYRKTLKDKGIIKYYGGKGEFLSRGYFDGVDIAIMVHANDRFFALNSSVGCVSKTIHYKGVSAHAGGAPWAGKNALYAAMQGISAANALRETFKESDIIRFHPIITHGGEAVNAIPELVTIEAYVRGASFDAIKNANQKINQALCGAALSVGTNIEIIDSPGYAPLVNDKNLLEVAKDAASLAIPEENFEISDKTSSGSTDMAELCRLMPTIHPYAGGATGKAHGDDYYIADPEKACIKSAKWQLAMLLILLKDDGTKAEEIIKAFKPEFKTAKEYLNYIDSFNSSGSRITYNENGTAEVQL